MHETINVFGVHAGEFLRIAKAIGDDLGDDARALYVAWIEARAEIGEGIGSGPCIACAPLYQEQFLDWADANERGDVQRCIHLEGEFRGLGVLEVVTEAAQGIDLLCGLLSVSAASPSCEVH